MANVDRRPPLLGLHQSPENLVDLATPYLRQLYSHNAPIVIRSSSIHFEQKDWNVLIEIAIRERASISDPCAMSCSVAVAKQAASLT